MKGLLLKDWYMMRCYCRMYLLIAVIFLAASCVSDNLFLVFYPSLLCGMIPVNLLSYDERSGWTQYCGALPCTKAQIVSAKYLIGLFSLLAVLAATGLVQTGRQIALGGSALAGLGVILPLTWAVATTCSAFCLPLVFRFGTEKGRVVYLVMVGLFFGVVAAASQLITVLPVGGVAPRLLLPGLALFATALYALSWYLSIVFYKAREI